MKVKNGIRYEKNGWIYVSIKGNAKERGYAHGYLVAKEIKEAFRMLDFSFYEGYGYKREMFSEITYELFGPQIKANYPELYEEMEGITAGAKAGGFKEITLEDIIMWNCQTSIDSFYSHLPTLIKNNDKLASKYGELFKEGSVSSGHGEGGALKVGGDKCTAFIVVGSYTKDGKIVCGHNSFDNFISGQNFNIILDVNPTKGNRFLMQCAAGYISSQTDYYVTSTGLIITETTIGGFNKFVLKDPICCRIRQAVQYSNTLDDVTKHLTYNNSGDYANSWLVGDTKTNTIMRIELGLEYVNVEKKKDGYFIGFNAPYDPRIRNLECANTGFDDIRRHQGARRVRLEQLMEEHKGKINVQIGQEIMADHYDIYLNKINPSSRTCCSHYELDDRAFMSDPSRPKPYQPRGAVDGIVCDTTLAKKIAFSARWGTSCGIPFNKTEFCKQNIIWKDQEPYLHDRPQQPWTEFTVHRGKVTNGDSTMPTGKNKTNGDTPSAPTRRNKTKNKEQTIAKLKKTKKAKLSGL
jgi:hypothetical protein